MENTSKVPTNSNHWLRVTLKDAFWLIIVIFLLVQMLAQRHYWSRRLEAADERYDKTVALNRQARQAATQAKTNRPTSTQPASNLPSN